MTLSQLGAALLALSSLAPHSTPVAPDGIVAFEPTALPPVEANGVVVDVSPLGQVVIAQAPDDSDEVCVDDGASGEPKACWDVPDRPGFASAIDWSPDGTRLAFAPPTGDQHAPGAPIRVLDTTSGHVTPVSDTPRDAIDAMPAWIDDQRIAFARLPLPDSSVFGADVVFTDLELGEDTIVETEIEHDAIQGQNAETIGGRYLLRVVTEASSQLTAIDPKGARETVMTSDWPTMVTTAATSDHRNVLVVSYDSERLELGPVAIINDNLSVTENDDIRGVTATFEPSGALIAAVEIENPGEGASSHVTLWDPASGDSERLVELDIAAIGIVWTADDRLIAWSDDRWQVIELERDA